MIRRCSALASTANVAVLCLLAMMTIAACQKIVGIHDSEVVTAGGAGQGGTAGASTSGQGGAATGGIPASNGGTRGGGAGSAPLADASVTDAVSSSTDAEGIDGSSVEASVAEDAMAADTSMETGAEDAGPDVAIVDAAQCATPWQAENAPLGVFTVNSGATTACSFSTDALPEMVAAVNSDNFRDSFICGACLRVTPSASTGSIVVQVVELGGSGLLLPPAAIAQLSPDATPAAVDWQLVACDTTEPVHYLVSSATNSFYASVQVRNHRYPVMSVEAVGGDGQAIALRHLNFNYWDSGSLGAGPVNFRLTDFNGQILDDVGILFAASTDVTGAGQFPVCVP